jgi:hypothetical protein
MSIFSTPAVNQGYKVALINVPRICTAATFVEDSRLFITGSKPPSTCTIRRWMRQGKVATVNLAGKTYINLHETLRRYNLGY